MDATALLIEARLFATKGSNLSEERRRDGTQSHESPTDGLIRALYAAAFSRFVTGFCDSRQTSNHKQTMYEVAATIGMPVTFVDLRHECAHADPPSLRRLERAVDQALDWIWEIYWTKLRSEGEDELPNNDNEVDLQRSDGEAAIDGLTEDEDAGNELEKQRLQDSLRAVLQKYLAVRKDLIFRRQGKSRDINIARLDESSMRSTYKELMQICNCKANRFRALQIVFLEVKIMLPSTDAASAEIMEIAFDLWDSLLQYIARRQPLFLFGLARTMLAALIKASNLTGGRSLFDDNKFSISTAAALRAWLSHILTSEVWLTFLRSSESDSGSSSKSEMRLYQQIVSECLLTPTSPTIRLAHEIVSLGSPSLRRDWAPAVNACLPLLEEWAAGPESISSGNGGPGRGLKVLEIPVLSDVTPDDAQRDPEVPEISQGSDKKKKNVPVESHDVRQQQHHEKEHSEIYKDLAMHGWSMWAGKKWTPTPIGVV